MDSLVEEFQVQSGVVIFGRKNGCSTQRLHVWSRMGVDMTKYQMVWVNGDAYFCGCGSLLFKSLGVTAPIGDAVSEKFQCVKCDLQFERYVEP